ncbi:MAG: hypothetical protein NC393_00585 [Clostridium sp.]|nr:hypothetical protein [Clostridium sp.]MCM1207310.1 hypothetical protein [Ruminococcus sp.]
MDFKEYLVNNLAKMRISRENGAVGGQASRAEAIEYLKEKRYELSESNVQIALKKIEEMNNYKEQIESEISLCMQKDVDELVDLFNSEIFNLINMPVTGINPVELIVEGEEKVELFFYTFLKIDERSYSSLSDENKEIVKEGLIGRLFVTDRRIIINSISSIFPLVDTTCASINDISSYGVSGINDEIFFVMSSGQRLTARVGQGVIKDYLNRIAQVINIKNNEEMQ